jgi:hypothetical protein
MDIPQKIKSSPHLIKIAKLLGIAIFVYTFVGFLIMPPVLKIVLTKQLSQHLHRDVAIQKITLNPFALSVNVNDLEVKNRNGSETFFSFRELYVNLQIASALKKGLILKEIRVDRPYVNVLRYEDELYNFSDLLEGDTSEPAAASEPFRFSLNNIQLLNGRIDFQDTPHNTSHEAKDITLTVPMLSNLPYHTDIYVQPFFSAVVNGTAVTLGGKTKPFSDSLETVIDLDINHIDIPHYLAYIPFEMNFDLLSGTIDGKSSISFTQYKSRPSTLNVSGDISIHNLRAVDTDGNPIIDLPVYSLRTADINVTEKEVMIGEIYSRNASIVIRRNKDGTLNLQRPLPKLAEEIEQAAEEKEESPWIVQINKMNYEDFSIEVEDSVPADTVHIAAEKIMLSGENISTKKNSRGALSYSFTLNETGTVSGESSFSINPVSADVKLSLKDIGIIPFQSYITDKIKILITDGAVSTEGRLSYVTSDKGEFNAGFKGEAAISDFASVDKINSEDFLKWDSLYLDNIDFGYDPFTLNIDKVALTDFYSRLIVNPDGSLNVQGIVKDEPEAEQAPEEERTDRGDVEQNDGQKGTISIRAVTLQGGNINFSDKYIKPNFSATLQEIGGRVSGLSSEMDSLADVHLSGQLEKHAPLEIKGKINPLREDLYVDLKVDFSDMELSPLTHYSGKYAGYTIQKGKLSLDLSYFIEKKKLDAKNNIFIDQFTFGEKVESPDATKLPVKFAISLLKNRNGEIKLDLPITGEIDDPEFSLGGVILKMISNILLKAATSPFALLGAIVGGGEELSYVDFDYGSFELDGQQKAKLDKLITALSDRPSLNIDIEGYVDIEKDRNRLLQQMFDNKLKAQKLKEVVDAGQASASVSDIEIAPDEYGKYLEKAYTAEEFPKPRNALGIAKTLPPSEMEKLILTHIEISDDDLRQLASKRALEVKDYLLKSGQIDQARVFLTQPESLQPEKKENLKSSRVDFRLK